MNVIKIILYHSHFSCSITIFPFFLLFHYYQSNIITECYSIILFYNLCAITLISVENFGCIKFLNFLISLVIYSLNSKLLLNLIQLICSLLFCIVIYGYCFNDFYRINLFLIQHRNQKSFPLSSTITLEKKDTGVFVLQFTINKKSFANVQIYCKRNIYYSYVRCILLTFMLEMPILFFLK